MGVIHVAFLDAAGVVGHRNDRILLGAVVVTQSAGSRSHDGLVDVSPVWRGCRSEAA